MSSVNHFVKFVIFLAAVLISSSFLTGQEVPGAPSAPIPSQIIGAKNVFIANAPGTNLPSSVGGPDRAYNEFYAAMKTWGRFKLMPVPADSDVILEISFTAPLGDVNNGSSVTHPQLNLVILDPKTHVSLWWLEQDVEGAFRAKTFNKNLGQAVDTLVKNLQALVARSAATPESTKQ